MLTVDRHRRLLEWLDESGSLRTSRMSAHLGVSVDTVRRDLDELERAGAIRRVRGGAVAARTVPSSFQRRLDDDAGVRGAIAEVIVGRLEVGMAIGLDAGSTSVEIARRIPRDLDLTVVTNGPMAMAELAGRDDVTVVSIGGRLDTRWMATIGSDAVAAIADHRLDLSVIGCCGLTPTSIATDSLDEVATKRAWIDAAMHTVIAADDTKLGVAARHRIAHPADIGELVVAPNGTSPQLALVEALRDHTDVTVVPATRTKITPTHTTTAPPTEPSTGKEPPR